MNLDFILFLLGLGDLGLFTNLFLCWREEQRKAPLEHVEGVGYRRKRQSFPQYVRGFFSEIFPKPYTPSSVLKGVLTLLLAILAIIWLFRDAISE